MNKFGDTENVGYLSRKSRFARDDSIQSKRDSKRAKTRAGSKSKHGKCVKTAGSLKRVKKHNTTGNLIRRHHRRYSKKSSKKLEVKVKKTDSSLMFSKFLRSMEMVESPVLKTEECTRPQREKSLVKWIVSPDILGVLLNSGALLIQILDCLINKKDIYDLIKDYVEISQSPLFNKLEDIMQKGKHKTLGNKFAINLKQERWVVLFFFYFSFKKKEKEKVGAVLIFLAKKICENFYSIMMSTRGKGHQGFDLEEVKKEINQLMKKGGFDVEVIKRDIENIASRNLTEVRNLLKICSSYFDLETKEKLSTCLSDCFSKRVCSITEECLETFYPFLAQNKVISVEIVESDKKKNKKRKKQKREKSISKISRKLEKELVKEESVSTKMDSKTKQISVSSKAKNSKLKKKKKKNKPSKSGTREFEEFIKQFETQKNDIDDQLFFFQPELEEEEEKRPDAPFLPKKKSKHNFTLVLDLDETLVHFEETEESQQFLVRPYAQQFLTEMGKYYEVVIFTAAVQEYADWILERIDEKKGISHRLYRQHTRPEHNVFIKDLSLLGRKVNKCIIVDNNAENFQKQPENGIFIKSWYGDQTDLALFKLSPILKKISTGGYDDVRLALKKLKEAMVRGLKKIGNSNSNDAYDEDKENLLRN